jgi:hypothetical protein
MYLRFLGMRNFLAISLILVLAFSGCLAQKCPDTYSPVCGSDGITYPNSCQAVQAGAQVKANGTCEANTCVDSDGGKDLFSEGTATGSAGSIQDKCKDALNIDEAYCNGKVAASETLPCPSGYACSVGQCEKVPCQDSDGGKDKAVKGTVTAPGKSLGDECVGTSAVKEYYCSGNDAASEEIQCGSGMQCASGACVEAPCSDSDGGKIAATAGTTRKGNDSYPDTCSGSANVKEYYCDSNTVRYETVACQSGFTCKDGACALEVCTDSDNGKDTATKGTTAYNGVSSQDSCYSTSQVIEYYCSSSTSVANEKISCGTGKECLDGKCSAVECQSTETNIDETDKKHSIASFDDGDEIVLHTGETVEINGGMFLKLYTVGSNSTTFRLYEDYAAFKDSDQLCSITINSGDSKDNFCSESTGTVEVLSVNDSEDTAELSIEKYYAVQYYDIQGTMTDWTNNPVCSDDTTVYDLFDAEFYPFASTASPLNLDGKKFVLFDGLATITDISDSAISFDFDGDDYDIESGDKITYNGQRYKVTLTFNDDGLTRFKAVPG